MALGRISNYVDTQVVNEDGGGNEPMLGNYCPEFQAQLLGVFHR